MMTAEITGNPNKVSTSPKEKSILLRKGSKSHMQLKEKIVQIYESFFRGEDPSAGNLNFWDEFFLLKVNCQYIKAEFEKLNGEQLITLKENINMMFFHCNNVLSDHHPIRLANALQTLCSLIQGVFSKSNGDYGFDIIDILMGFDNADIQMKQFTENFNSILNDNHPAIIKNRALNVMLVLATSTDNISQNTILEYLMCNSIFESVVQLIGNPVARSMHGHDAVLLLTILVQYRKHESINPYIVKLSILDDELILNGYAQILASSLTEFNRLFHMKNTEQDAGFFTTFTNFVGSMFVAEEKNIEAVKANDSILLAIYEAVHLNRNFIATLTNSHAPSTQVTPPESPSLQRPQNVLNGKEDKLDAAALLEPCNQPTNLLVTFLEYCSIIYQDIRDPARYNNTKLCMIILLCIAEDQYANSLMHDVNMNFRVPLHRTPMRHRKLPIVDTNPPCRPLIGALIDLMTEFMLSHMMKNFPMELYNMCLSILHKVLCYQKKCRIRLNFVWKDLWSGLISLLKFILSHEPNLAKKYNIFYLSCQVVNIFNMFITYGDTFLPTPNSYDELYYEIIRMHQIFDSMYSMALRYTTSDGQYKDSAVRLTNALINVKAIINHFSPKVETWATVNQLSALTEEQVLAVVRNNYDTLTLKLQSSLDQCYRYEEKPKEMAFFTQLVRSIVSSVKKLIDQDEIQSQQMIQELSIIS